MGGGRHWHAFQIDFESKLQIKRVRYPGPLIWHQYVFINSKFSIIQLSTPFGKNSLFNSAISVFGYEWSFVMRRFINIGLGVQQEGKYKGTYTNSVLFNWIKTWIIYYRKVVIKSCLNQIMNCYHDTKTVKSYWLISSKQ